MTDRHVNGALDELLVAGGVLAVRLLGGEPSRPGTGPSDAFGRDPEGKLP